MTVNLNLANTLISTMKFIQTREYCQKIANITQNIQNLTPMEKNKYKR